MSDRPHVLYVAWGFPPCRSGGVYRALATAKAFADGGADVTVLTVEREVFERYTDVDAALEEQIDPRLRVVRLPFSWPARETDRSRWSPARRAAPRVWWRARKMLDRLPFPEVVYGPWRATLERAALAVHAERPVDLVVATANPNVDFAAADVLARRHGVPYVMDYRDAWLLDVFSGAQLFRDGGRVDRLERRLLAGAREVWFVNEPIRAWHAARHPAIAGRMHVVANGVDPQYAPRPRLDARPADGPLRFGYIGTMSGKVPLREFADGWRLARARDPRLADARADLWGHVGYYASAGAAGADLLGSTPGVDDGITLAGPVSKTAVADVYADLDALLLILGSGRYVTSGKVYEYAASALPIVSVHDPGNAASDVLRDYPLWFPAGGLDPESIAAALCAAAEAVRTADEVTRAACARFAARYDRDLQLSPRVAALLDP